MEQNGLYARLYAMQFRTTDSEPTEPPEEVAAGAARRAQ